MYVLGPTYDTDNIMYTLTNTHTIWTKVSNTNSSNIVGLVKLGVACTKVVLDFISTEQHIYKISALTLDHTLNARIYVYSSL